VPRIGAGMPTSLFRVIEEGPGSSPDRIPTGATRWLYSSSVNGSYEAMAPQAKL
jgi:hypothetical protein